MKLTELRFASITGPHSSPRTHAIEGGFFNRALCGISPTLDSYGWNPNDSSVLTCSKCKRILTLAKRNGLMKIERTKPPTLYGPVTIKCPRCGRDVKWPTRIQKVTCPCGAELKRKY